MPKEPSAGTSSGADGERERRSRWARFKAWFWRPTPKRDSYVSNVTNPDDRRYIPRR
jgi:hypothetical protein